MSQIGYLTLWGHECICFEENDVITVGAIDKSAHFDFRHIQDKNFDIEYTDVIGVSIAKIECVKSIEGNVVYLKVKYVYDRVTNKDIYKLEITGASIDDFFNPVFYFNNLSDDNKLLNEDYLYNSKEIDKWIIKYNNENITIKLKYGNILSYGILGDLKLKPILSIEFPKTTDFDYVYRMFKVIENTIKLIDCTHSVGDFKVKLVSIVDNHDSYSGNLHIFGEKKPYYKRHIATYNYSGYKKYIERFFQFSSSFSYSIAHFTDYGFRDLIKGYTNIEFANIFNAFEYECHVNSELYEKTDGSIYSKIKESMICKIDEIPINGLTDKEKSFVSDTKDEINRRGSTMGLRKKIINAYDVLKKPLDSSINNIFYNPKYRLSGTIKEEDIKKISKRLVDIRGAIFHGSYIELTDIDTQKIRFLEIIVYGQMLLRMNFDENEIERIIGSVFGTNHIMTEDFLKNKRISS